MSLRLLADIALRALSPAVNDPTTAVQALDAIDSLLRPLAGRALDVGRIHDAQGTLRHGAHRHASSISRPSTRAPSKCSRAISSARRAWRA